MKNKWHTYSLEEIFSKLGTNPDGLTIREAEQRLKKSGRNVLPQEKPLSRARLFLSQFNSPLMYILLVAILISFFLKHYSDSFFIAVVLLINTSVGFYQENKANQSLGLLRKMVKIKVRVLRETNSKEIDSEELVVGDIILIGAGDKVPADGRLFKCKNLKINESILTGEWQAAEKNTDKMPADALLPERLNMAFMGTIVEEGSGAMVVTATGADTQIGEIVSLLRQTKERRTPLQRKIASLSKLVGAFILSVVFVIVTIGFFSGKSFVDVFVTSLALAVSAIPEGLLPAITVILALGMRRILKQNGLVRKLIATETLGGVSVICTDKTGTLTEAKMRVSHILTSAKELMGENIGDIAGGENINGLESHILALKIAVLTNEAFVENPEAEFQEWIVRGRPTDQALLLAGLQAGLNKKELERQFPLVDKISFDSDLKYAAVLHQAGRDNRTLYVVGAPEKIINRCAFLDIDGRKEAIGGVEADKLIEKLQELADKGLRVLACAYRSFEAEKKYHNLNDLAEKLVLVGFVALKDPLRQDAKEMILAAKKAGIRTIIITGDHKLTAQAVARELGFNINDGQVIEGGELDKISEEELRQRAKDIFIYARVSPRHKSSIIKALQAEGEVVAMVGDGVNDAPALKAADVGVAVGSGTDVAKETADLVLLDDSFKTIVKAIEQGRVIFNNIRRVFVYLVADDFSEIFLFLGSMIMGWPLPLLPAQILWINIVEDGFPSIALTTEQEIKGVMEEKPRRPDESILHRPLKLWMISIFFISGLAPFLLFFAAWRMTGDLQNARTIVFALICLDSLIFAFCVRSFKKMIFRRDIFSNHYLTGAVAIGIILLLAAIYLPPLQKILGTQALSVNHWLIISAISGIEILLLELFKKKIFTGKFFGA